MISNEEAQLSKISEQNENDLYSISSSSNSIRSISSISSISSDSINLISSSSNELKSISSGSNSYRSIKSEHIVDNKNACYEKDSNRRRILIEQAMLSMDETDSDSYNNDEEYRLPEPSFINKKEIKEIKKDFVLIKEKHTLIPFSSENLNNIK